MENGSVGDARLRRRTAMGQRGAEQGGQGRGGMRGEQGTLLFSPLVGCLRGRPEVRRCREHDHLASRTDGHSQRDWPADRLRRRAGRSPVVAERGLCRLDCLCHYLRNLPSPLSLLLDGAMPCDAIRHSFFALSPPPHSLKQVACMRLRRLLMNYRLLTRLFTVQLTFTLVRFLNLPTLHYTIVHPFSLLPPFPSITFLLSSFQCH